MPVMKCRNCGFRTADGVNADAQLLCPECCGRMHIDESMYERASRPVRASCRLAVTKWAPADGRYALRALSEELGALAEPAELLVSELITNAVLHAGARVRSAITLAVEEREGNWRIEVADDGPGLNRSPSGADRDDEGYGLMLVQGLADRWDVEPRGGGSAVWIELGPLAAERWRSITKGVAHGDEAPLEADLANPAATPTLPAAGAPLRI
jgi:anti-sigma regulatory factor (Ser/Thr protein kinase)